MLVISSLHVPCCLGKDKMNGPVKSPLKNLSEAYGRGDNTFLNMYQKWISPVKGGNTCPMYPACSQYAKIAFKVLPWHQAYSSSLERLLRCGNDLHFYPTIIINGQKHWHDPVFTKDEQHDIKTDEENH